MARSGLPELEGLNGASSRIKALSTVPKVFWPTLILQARGLELRLWVRLHVVVQEQGGEGDMGAENTVGRVSALRHLTTGWSGIIKEYAKIVRSWE